MADRSPMPVAAPQLQLRPMIHVPDMAAAVTFYEHLGGSIIHGARDSDWVLMQVGTAQVGLIEQPPDAARGEGTVELNFNSPVPLEELERLLREGDVNVTRVANDPWSGRQLHVKSPDGALIKINELEPDSYV